MTKIKVYNIVTDNDGKICIDNNGNIIILGWEYQKYKVKKMHSKWYPCNQCRFRNSIKFPNTKVHNVQQQGKGYLPNIRAGITENEYGYAEYVGDCEDYEELT